MAKPVPKPASFVASVSPAPDPSVFNILSPDQMANALIHQADLNGLEKSQELYAKAALMSVAANATALMADESSTHSKTTARIAAPAYSLGRVMPYEKALYDLVDKAKDQSDVDTIKTIARPQIFTATTHPNFSRSQKLVEASHTLITTLGTLDQATQTAIQQTGQLPAETAKIINEQVEKVKNLSQTSIPRDKRSRRDELQETVLNFIPTAMDAVAEQMDIFKKRRAMLSEDASGTTTSVEREKSYRRPGKDGKIKWAKVENVGSTGSAIPPQFHSLKQLDALAALMPQYNSWFADGDGKDTCHVYDAEMAIPAIKRATYQYYRKAIDEAQIELPDPLNKKLEETLKILEDPVFDGNGKPVLDKDGNVIKGLEGLATERMNALNEMQNALAAHNRANDEDLEAVLEKPTAAAAEASKAYISMLEKNSGEKNEKGEPIKVKDLLRHQDLAAELKQAVGNVLEDAYRNRSEVGEAKIQKMENVYVQLASMGNYAVHLERRENARQYNEVLRYLIQSNTALRTKLADQLMPAPASERNESDPEKREEAQEKRIATFMARLRRDQISAKGSNGENYFTKAVEAITGSLMDPNDPLEVRKSFLKTYRRLAGKLEKSINLGNNGHEELVTEPLERRELLTLDALGYFNMAHLYPEAMKGGFVVAEFAQPANKLLDDASKDPFDSKAQQAVKDEVGRRAQTEMLMQMALAMGMQKTNGEKKDYLVLPEGIPIMPLHEDPATLQYMPDFQKEFREKDSPILKYLLSSMGVDPRDPQTAEKKAARYFDASVQAKPVKDSNGNPKKDDKGNPIYEYDVRLAEPTVEKLTAYQELRRHGYTDEELTNKKGLDQSAIAKLKKTFVLEGPPDMEACSDNSKRATIIGAELAEHSVREKALQAALHPIPIGGINYMLKKPKYLGQGGAIQRATEVPLDSVQATLQGAHQANYVPRSLAHKMTNYLMGRLFLTHEAALGANPAHAKYYETPQTILDLAANGNFHAGNILGLPGHVLEKDEKIKMDTTIRNRVRSTLGDPRYDAFLEKYGETMPNYSARADSKGAKKGFSEKRAIGLAAEEWFAGAWSNVIGMASLFGFLNPAEHGSDADTPHPKSIETIQNWKKEDYSIQQRLMASALITSIMNPAHGWERGDIEYKGPDAHGQVMLIKNQEGKKIEVPLSELDMAYEANRNKEGDNANYISKNGATFDAADLVKAHLTQQYLNLERGLKEVYKKDKVLDIFEPVHRPRIEQIKAVNDNIGEALRANKIAASYAKSDDEAKKLDIARKRLKAAYYEMFEGGGNLLFPQPKLMEQKLYQDAVTRQPPTAHARG